MKKYSKLLLMLFVIANTLSAFGQLVPINEKTVNASKQNQFQLSTRVGIDFPMYKNNTPYIDYEGGLGFGVSGDYYWTWYGLGIDFDYINNNPNSTYPNTDLFDSTGNTITNTTLNEENITRTFIGLGPNVQYKSINGKFTAELNTRFGISSIKGGRTLLMDDDNNRGLNFHAGYDATSIMATKGQVRFNYFFNKSKTLGVHIGAYYLKHFGATELSEGNNSISAGYQPYTEDLENILISDGEPMTRAEPCDCDISSIGVFSGLTYRFAKKENVCNVCGKDHSPHCEATTDDCGVTITAKDKFTGEVLPETDIILTDLKGNVIQSGSTNAYGFVIFNDVPEDNYLIRGKLYNVDVDGSIAKSDFEGCKKNGVGVQKVIEYADENFILKGNVVECNTANGIQSVDVLLQNKLKADQKNTLSDESGNFIFHLDQDSTYELSGKKDGYYSNKVEVSTKSHDRKTTLFIDFEMCSDPCGKAIKLENINFDLDKAEILPEAIPDLQRVIKLMRDNLNINVEMSSHTDSQGSDSYNQKLSQRRAEATVNYIASQGISRSRLIARGAGESELKNTKCDNNTPCTDDEHRVNRRTEFKVVCY